MGDPMYREFTIGEALDALKADAIRWTSGQIHYVNSKGEVEKACAIGIMAINLGVKGSELQSALSGAVNGLGTIIVQMNDKTGGGLNSAIEAARKKVTQADLDKKIKVRSEFYVSVVTK